MRQKSSPPETPSERLVRDIRRATRKQYSAEEKIRIVLDGLRGEVSIAELCRREAIAQGIPRAWPLRAMDQDRKSSDRDAQRHLF
jgi:transposase